MAEQDKMFICYKGGGGIKITPANAAGWRAFGIWMSAFGLATLVFVLVVTKLHSARAITSITVGFTILVLLWAVTMIRWMMNRSEVVDTIELLQLKRELDAKKDRSRR